MDLSRRDFTKLSMAAFGGMLAGAGGCGGSDPPKPVQNTPAPPAGEQVAAAEKIHACRGLNACQGLGADGKNACAGQGTCSTVKEHTCGGINECKGQGGCGDTPGANACKGMGNCHVPITATSSWETARKLFEERMKAANKQVGAAPPAKAEG